MKKFIYGLISIMLVLTLTGCGSDTKTDEKKTDNKEDKETKDEGKKVEVTSITDFEYEKDGIKYKFLKKEDNKHYIIMKNTTDKILKFDANIYLMTSAEHANSYKADLTDEVGFAPNSTVAYPLGNYNVDFVDHTIKFVFKDNKNVDLRDKVKIVEDNKGIYAINNSNTKMSTKMTIIYYKDNKPVSADYASTYEAAPKEKQQYQFTAPSSYDRYELYLDYCIDSNSF